MPAWKTILDTCSLNTLPCDENRKVRSETKSNSLYRCRSMSKGSATDLHHNAADTLANHANIALTRHPKHMRNRVFEIRSRYGKYGCRRSHQPWLWPAQPAMRTEDQEVLTSVRLQSVLTQSRGCSRRPHSIAP
jgi:hypothetical protein